MAQAADGFLLDLPDTFAGEVELLTDLFQRHGVFAVEAEIKRDHVDLIRIRIRKTVRLQASDWI